jgi:inorganic triphosphatase YgiF
MGRSQKSERETETALVICSDDPASIARRIAGLAEIASYRLLRRPSIRLRDLYFDTPDGLLRKQHLAVRLRESDQVWLITLKGPSRPAAGGSMESRDQVPWSKGARAVTRNGQRILNDLRLDPGAP